MGKVSQNVDLTRQYTSLAFTMSYHDNELEILRGKSTSANTEISMVKNHLNLIISVTSLKLLQLLAKRFLECCWATIAKSSPLCQKLLYSIQIPNLIDLLFTLDRIEKPYNLAIIHSTSGWDFPVKAAFQNISKINQMSLKIAHYMDEFLETLHIVL